MKLLGVEIEAADVLRKVEARLNARGIQVPPADDASPERVEPRVDPVQHHLTGLERNGDPTEGLPLYSHRTGLGRAVLVAKWIFRKTCQPLINEALGRQRLFNSHVRDAYSDLAARVERLGAEVEQLQAKEPAKRAVSPRKAAQPGKPSKPAKRRPTKVAR